MTMRRAIVYAVFLIAAVVLWLFTYSEQAQIKRVFAAIEKIALKEPGESVMECAAKSQSLARYFKNGCVVVDLRHGQNNTTYSRNEIAGGLLAFRSGVAKIVVTFRDLQIGVEGDKARVEGYIDYSGTEVAWSGYESKIEKFLAHLEKIDGRWLISRIKAP